MLRTSKSSAMTRTSSKKASTASLRAAKTAPPRAPATARRRGGRAERRPFRAAKGASLLKSILMLVTPHAGTVRLFGAPHHLPSSRARLAYLPEKFQPPGHLFGHDFVRMTLAFYRARGHTPPSGTKTLSPNS